MDCVIAELLEYEASCGELNYDAEKQLHVLFENRKHAAEWHKARETEKSTHYYEAE